MGTEQRVGAGDESLSWEKGVEVKGRGSLWEQGDGSKGWDGVRFGT